MRTIVLGIAFALCASAFAQVPTNGLVAYYPFNGNANDESGNNLHGIVYGATLTSDRNNKPNRRIPYIKSLKLSMTHGGILIKPFKVS